MNTFKSHHHLTCRHGLDGTILAVNQVAARALHTECQKLVGGKIQDLLTEAGSEAFDDYIERIRRDGFAEGTMVVRGTDGKLRTWEYRNTLQIRKGEPIVHGTACDVTEREEAIRTLIESEQHFRSIIENVSDVITIVDPEGTVRYATPSVQTLLGYTPDQVQGRSIFELVHNGDAQRAAEFFGSLQSPAEAIELRFSHADGSPRFVEVVARKVVRKEQVTGIIATARDITERRRLQNQLQAAHRLSSLGRLAATVAHEFNNVLMSMQPFAELLQKPKAPPEIVLKSAWHIAHSIGRGKRIAQDILRFTQPAEPALMPVKISEWWSALRPEVAAIMSDNIDIVTDFDDPAIFVMADASQLAQVFVNLLTNARDAMRNGGTITVRARQDSARSMVHLSVSDNGCGITADMLQHIFEPLFTSKAKGTGLGLAVAYHVVKRHNGDITVESTPGQGTTFHIYIPSALSTPEAVDQVHTRAQIRSRRVLMVEDEPAIVEGIVELLREENLEVSTVGSGEEAVEAIEKFDPDIVLLDYGLPGIDGLETCRRIRLRRPDQPVIFSSGHGTEAQLGAEFNDARTAYLQKPFDMSTLLDAIAEVEVDS